MFGISNVELYVEKAGLPEEHKKQILLRTQQMAGTRRILHNLAAIQLFGRSGAGRFLSAVKHDPQHEACLCEDMVREAGSA